MTDFTYTELEAALLAYTEDQSVEYAANMPTIIKMGQDRVIRDLDLEIFKKENVGTFTLNVNTISKPAGLISVSSIRYKNTADSNKVVYLEPRSSAFCIMYSGVEGEAGTPKFYDEGYSDTQIYVSKAPSTAFTYTIRGLHRPTYMSPTTSSNWLGKFAGDLLLYACLMESERFLMSVQEGKPQEWAKEYAERIPAARSEVGTIARAEYTPMQNTEEPRA